MTIRNLERLFNPESVALIGASTRVGSLGAVLARNLMDGGFKGPILPVHPKHDAIEGVLAYGSVAELPRTPDLAVIATPPETVPGLIAELGKRGTKAAVVISAGLGALGEETSLVRRALEAARPHLLRIVGPNCLGVMVPAIGLNATFSHLAPPPGDLAFLTQSGAMVTAMLDWAAPRGIGFSHVVSLGDKSDVDFGDLLDYLALQGGTRAILLYVEAIAHARKFMSAARIAARTKPVIVIKGGRHAEGQRAAASHTGALAGSDAVYDAAFARAGMLRVFQLAELFDAAETLVTARPTAGNRLAVLTNGGGLGVLAADAVVDQGAELATLAPETIAALDKALPATWSKGNPVDIIGDADAARYRGAIETLLADPNSDALLVLNCPTAIASSEASALAAVEPLKQARRPVFTSWVGDATARAARKHLEAAGIPTYDTPEQAARAFMYLERYRRNQAQLFEAPPSLPPDFAPDAAGAQRIVAQALAAGRSWLDEIEIGGILSAYGIPAVQTRLVATPEEALAVAEELGLPVAVKIHSPDITHKSDIGGVELELDSNEAVLAAAKRILEKVKRARPEARIAGLAVQPMVRRRDAHELILGMSEDPTFGPVLLFGQGGTAVEVVADKALALPPLNLNLAQAMMAETRVYRLLKGYRDRPPAALDEIALTLVKLAQLAADLPQVIELDINPLLADARGVLAVDARLRVAPAARAGSARFAIRPYPRQLEETVALPDGQEVFLRPIRPEDGPALEAAFAKLSPEDVRLRFFAPLGRLSPAMVSRLTQIDYHREMALAALNPAALPATDGWGVVRISADPDFSSAEFAIVVRSDVKGRGLGRVLLRRILAYAEARGIGTIWGHVLAENDAMRKLARELGFAESLVPEEPGVIRLEKRLTAEAAEAAAAS